MAARRNDRVSGRTIILVVSIITRNGFNQSGAPSGNRWAIVFFGLKDVLDKINLNHIGNPKARVKIRCLDVLNVYGIMPIKLIIIKIINVDEIIEDAPFNWCLNVRLSCVKIVDFNGTINVDCRVLITQYPVWISNTSAVFVIINREFVGNSVLYM